MYDTLVLSGGSVKGIAMLGTLYCLEYNKHLEVSKVKNFAGTSIGSVICYLLIIGYTPLEIVNYLCSCDLFDELGKFDITNIFSGSLFRYSIFNEHLERLTIDKIGKFHTMKSLRELTGKDLICTTYRFQYKKPGEMVYLNADNSPDLPVLVALRMSCNLPYIFGNYKYDGWYYIDGGFSDNFPISYFKDDEKILGINVIFEKVCPEDFDKKHLKFLIYLLSIPMASLERMRIAESKCQSTIIPLSLPELFLTDFNLSVSQILNIFSTGYKVNTRTPAIAPLIDRVVNQGDQIVDSKG